MVLEPKLAQGRGLSKRAVRWIGVDPQFGGLSRRICRPDTW
jgi:hypothetical protein